MRNTSGEMPFLDHLEELRKRILLSVLGIVIGVAVSWPVTTHFRLPEVVQQPIAPYVPGGRLIVLNPIDPFMIYLKFALVLGIVLASPFVLYQVWLFLAPALTAREKKAIVPSLFAGMLLFLGGAAVGWFFVLTPTVRWLLTFKNGTFVPQITYDSYLELVLHLLLAMGISAELPLVMILLAALGVMTHRRYVAWRRFALFGCLIGGAILSPAPEVVSMILFSLPLVLLYEVGVWGAFIVERRRLRGAAVVAGLLLLGLMVTPQGLHAQNPPIPGAQGPPRADTGRRSVTGQGVRSIDSSTAKRLGIPTAPSVTFPAADSIMQSLLDREGFSPTRFAGDSASFMVDSDQVVLSGHAATNRDNAQLEARRIVDNDAQCLVQAEGEPRMFEPGHSALIGVTMRFNTCSQQGTIGTALTSVPMEGSNWFVLGNLQEQEGGKRVYAANSQFTSCDLPDPHYHFVAKEVKWQSGSNAIIVARPAVLYIRDVPVAWLPFIFQNTKTGRTSGILIPHFGFNDIVRPTSTYNRAITNIGYYWAPNDYVDVSAHLDWVSNRYVTYAGTFNYRWLNEFVQGGITLSNQIQTDGSSSRNISWTHNQSFSTTTKVALNFNYASNSQVLLNNAIDPLTSTQLITSQLSLDKTFSWGHLAIGGNRSQPVGPGITTTVLPQIALTPRSIAIGQHLTWSPTLSVRSSASDDNSLTTSIARLINGGIDTLAEPTHARTTDIQLATPLQIYGFQLTNSVEYNDQRFAGTRVVTTRVPNLATPDPNDSVTVQTYRSGDFETGVNFTPSVSLPLLFRGSWKVTPSVGVSNVLPSAPLLVRTPTSNGNWVSQGFKPSLQLQSAPSFFGFINRGIGPYQRFRYTLSPILTLNWSPAASVSQAFARAIASTGAVPMLTVPASMSGSVAFHQVFEAKAKRAATDTNTDPIHLASLPKKQLLSVSTSPLSYDFEQAKLPGRSGWTTSVLSNSFTSDLVPGFTLSTTHDLWQGDAGSDTAKFSPFLANVQTNFRLTGSTFRSLAALLGLAHRDTVTTHPPISGAPAPLAVASSMSMLRAPNGVPPALGRTGFSATISYQLTRYRKIGSAAELTGPVSTEPDAPGTQPDPFQTNPLVPPVTPPAASSLGLTLSFSPSAFWTASWMTQYDFTTHSFQSQQIQLQRDLHEWRASFNFTKGPNGNFALYFTIYLMSLPDIKFDYNQTTLQQAATQP